MITLECSENKIGGREGEDILLYRTAREFPVSGSAYQWVILYSRPNPGKWPGSRSSLRGLQSLSSGYFRMHYLPTASHGGTL